MTLERSTGTPAFIDDHDAGLEALCVFAEGVAELRFSGLNAFWPTSLERDESEAYEVVRHRAVLRLRGLTSIAGGCDWEPNVSLGDGEVYDASGERICWRELLTPTRIQRLWFLFQTGDVLELHSEEALLSLEAEGKYRERWSGPLVSQPAPDGSVGGA